MQKEDESVSESICITTKPSVSECGYLVHNLPSVASSAWQTQRTSECSYIGRVWRTSTTVGLLFQTKSEHSFLYDDLGQADYYAPPPSPPVRQEIISGMASPLLLLSWVEGGWGAPGGGWNTPHKSWGYQMTDTLFIVTETCPQQPSFHPY